MKKLDRMTQEDKQLLLKDLCARLLYGVKVNYADKTYDALGYYGNNLIIVLPFMSNLESHPIETCKPYLRPLSSMTDKEIADAGKYIYNTDKVIYTSNGDDGFGFYADMENGTRIRFNEIEFKLGYYGPKGIDWLNAHHFDYRGLIPMGLAIEAPEDMYIVT